jgi:YidC/Oxa1 family membrane protein insertase
LNFDKTSIIGLIACVLGYITYENYMNSKYPNRFKSPSPQTKVSLETVQKPILPKVAEETAETKEDLGISLLSDEDLTIKTSVAEYIFDQKSGGLKHLRLSKYLDESKKNSIDLIPNNLELYGSSFFSKANNFTHNVSKQDREITFWRMEGPWKISHTYKIDSDSSYGFDLIFSWENTSSTSQELKSVVYLNSNIVGKNENQAGYLEKYANSALQAKKALLVGVQKDAEWKDLKEFCTEDQVGKKWNMQKIDYFGIDDHYFIKVLLPQSKFSYFSYERKNKRGCQAQMQTYLDQGEVDPGQSVNYSFKGWFGPKALSQVEAYAPVLTSCLDFGFFATVSEWLFALLQACFNFVGNWGFAIILMTIIIKTLFYPLTKITAVSMHKMKALQPEMNLIKEKFKDDPAKQQKEVMKFMSANKVNPLKGCLPILPTIPVFIAFWRVLSSSIELRHANFWGWIGDLSQKDPYYITPIILMVVMFVQQKLTPNTSMDKTQEKIMLIMPIMFGVISLNFPAGMVLYMLTNAIVSILQQQWLNKKLQTV